jgi:hypothetical protein
MTTLPSRQSPGGVVVIGIDRIDRPAVDPNSTAYSLSFGAILLGRVAGLDALQNVLQKLKVPSCAIETACLELTKRPHHDISDVTLTPALIRELGM